MITAQQAFDDFKLYKKDLGDLDANTFLAWVNYINNYIYNMLLGTNSEDYLKTIAVNVIKGTSTYTLPVDFEDVKHWGTGLFKSDVNGKINEALPVTMPGSYITGYHLSGNTLVLTPIPENNDTYYLTYIPKIAKITSLSDETLIEDRFMDYFVKALDVLYTQWDEEKTDEGYADARFVRCLNNILDNSRRTPAVYIMY